MAIFCSLGWKSYVSSFHICNEDIGGAQLTIDITKYHDAVPDTIPDVLESYRDVCTCINVPQYVQNMTQWTINNHGNDFFAYYQPNCSESKWKAQYIAADFECFGSRCMNHYEKFDSVTNTKYKIQSIGPNTNSKYFKTRCTTALQKDVLNLGQNHEHDFSSFNAKNDQLKKRIDTLLNEIQAMKVKTVELESKLENKSRSYEYSVKKLKNDFEIFI